MLCHSESSMPKGMETVLYQPGSKGLMAFECIQLLWKVHMLSRDEHTAPDTHANVKLPQTQLVLIL